MNINELTLHSAYLKNIETPPYSSECVLFFLNAGLVHINNVTISNALLSTDTSVAFLGYSCEELNISNLSIINSKIEYMYFGINVYVLICTPPAIKNIDNILLTNVQINDKIVNEDDIYSFILMLKP